MTDDSFLNLRGKEALVNIYYNIYNTNASFPLKFRKLSSVITVMSAFVRTRQLVE